MRREERVAIVRIFTDLIKADSVIDINEMEYYERIKSIHSINHTDEVEANGMTLSAAVDILSQTEDKCCKEILKECCAMTIADGFCAKSEALLMLALHCCLEEEYRESCKILSVNTNSTIIDKDQLLYIESYHDSDINSQIKTDYRHICGEMKMCGFNFVYIPSIVAHYQETPRHLIEQVFRFLLPMLSEERILEVICKLSNMRTEDFVNDILCVKLGIKELKDTLPALLLYVGESHVDDKNYTNFLKLDIDGENVIETVQKLMDLLASMQQAEYMRFRTIEDSKNKFIYQGFYKQLIDLFMLKQNVKSRIVINPYKESIVFVDIDQELSSLHRKEKALYTLFLLESKNGGVNFNTPKTASEMKVYNEKLKVLQRKYAYIYGLFGGDKNKAPLIEQAEIRRPMLSNIKRSILRLSQYLYNVNDYVIERDKVGYYNVKIPQTELYGGNLSDKFSVPITETQLYEGYIKQK